MLPAPCSLRSIKVPQIQFRIATFDSNAVDDINKTVRLSVSSDEPYLRYDPWSDKEYYEVLDHSPEGIQMDRLKSGTPLLFNHNRDQHLGRNNEILTDGKKLEVVTKFSRSAFASDKWKDVEDGILVDSSVGYQVIGKGKQIAERDGIPVLKFKWQPHEASLVTIPADTTVGIGRSLNHQPTGELTLPMEVEIEGNASVDNQQNANATRTATRTNMSETTVVLPPAAPVITLDESAITKRATEVERKRVADIRALSKHFAEKGLGGRKINTAELAADYIADGKSEREFQDAVVRGNFEDAVVQVDDRGRIGMAPKDLSKYSIVRALNRLGNKKPLDGLEAECSRAHVSRTGQEQNETGFFIPQDVLEYGWRSGTALTRSLRALFADGNFGGAGALVPDEFHGDSFIELLRNKMAVAKMGARFLSGLRGNVQIPLQSGGATASWLAEDATISASQQTVGQLALVPHRLGAATAYTYQLIAQTENPSIESFVREDLMAVIAIAKDLAAIAGTGVSGQPVGILNTSNLSTSVTFANAQTMLYSDALIFENNVAINNADLGSLGYLSTPTVRKNAKAIAEISSAGAAPVWKNDQVNGFKAFATNQVPTATSVIFGNWDDLIIADWAGQQVVVDPYSLSLAGQVRIVVQQLCDNGLRHSKSFSVSTN